MLSVVCFYKQKHSTKFKLGLYPLGANLVYQTNDVVLEFGLQTPLSITILRSKEMGTSYPFVLAAVLNCHNSIRNMV